MMNVPVEKLKGILGSITETALTKLLLTTGVTSTGILALVELITTVRRRALQLLIESLSFLGVRMQGATKLLN